MGSWKRERRARRVLFPDPRRPYERDVGAAGCAGSPRRARGGLAGRNRRSSRRRGPGLRPPARRRWAPGHGRRGEEGSIGERRARSCCRDAAACWALPMLGAQVKQTPAERALSKTDVCTATAWKSEYSPRRIRWPP
ncbi:hypothetical protein MRB53_039963 [Persea americana]|nr:hypothetical protein MRB53_039963 [Persea americana]